MGRYADVPPGSGMLIVIDGHVRGDLSTVFSDNVRMHAARMFRREEEKMLALVLDVTVERIRIMQNFSPGWPIDDARKKLRARWSR